MCLTTVLAAVLTGWAAAGNQTIEINRYSFGAIAYSPSTGKFGYSYNYRNRATAEKVALQNCRAADARVVGWVNAGFLALALGSDKSCWGIGWSHGSGSSNTEAKDEALEDCRTQNCAGAHVALALSSDGQYVWDPLQHTVVIDKDGNVRDGYGNLITPTPSPAPTPVPTEPEGKDWRSRD